MRDSLSTRHSSYDEKRLHSGDNGIRQLCVRRFVREVFFAGEKSNERPPLQRHVVPNGSAQNRMAGFERIKDRANRNWRRHIEFHFALHASEIAQVKWKHDADHGSVCTSTDKTAGRSRTIGFHVSPLSAEP